MDYIFSDKLTEDIRKHRDALADTPMHLRDARTSEVLDALNIELRGRAHSLAVAFATNPAEPAAGLDETVPCFEQARAYALKARRCLGAIDAALSCLRSGNRDRAREVLEERIADESGRPSWYAAEQAERNDSLPDTP